MSRRPAWRRRLLIVYLVLVVASFIVQMVRDATRSLPSDRAFADVPRMTARGPNGGEPVRLAAIERDGGSGTPLILLHGSPGSAGNFRRLVQNLGTDRRVIALDLPGFGGSDRWVPDYGIDAHARYVLAYMDERGIDRAHVLGFSMGSGVGLHMVELAPERVASLIMLGGIGIQEGEGSGDYHFEHLKYLVGYATLVVGAELVPHFGLLGPRAARHAFLRNFMDTDQRPLRSILASLGCPLLILHGSHDFLVPPDTASDHHEIARASELVLYDDDHFMIFKRAGAIRLAADIDEFIGRADAGAAPTRRTLIEGTVPEPKSILPAGLEVDRRLGPWRQAGILAAATMLSEDLTCITAGLLIRQGRLDFFVGVIGCLVGIFLGDIGLWLAGRLLGRRLLAWPCWRAGCRRSVWRAGGAGSTPTLAKRSWRAASCQACVCPCT
ncbi:MAG: alpha/beta fold hydrolase [Planctomycetota bacterium]|jgi:pimeloyl-ACP methyl ester carboxylesterase